MVGSSSRPASSDPPFTQLPALMAAFAFWNASWALVGLICSGTIFCSSGLLSRTMCRIEVTGTVILPLAVAIVICCGVSSTIVPVKV